MPYSRGRPSSGPSIISMLSDRYKEPDSAQTQPAGAGRPRIAYGQTTTTTTVGSGGAGKPGSHQRTEETTYSFSQEEEIRQDGRTVYKTKEEKSFSEKPRPWPGENAAPAPKVSIKTISLSTKKPQQPWPGESAAPAPKVSIKTITLSTKGKDDGQTAKLTNSFGGPQKDSFPSGSGQPHRQDYHYQQTISTKTQVERGGIPQQQQPQIHQIQQQSVYQQQKQPTYGQPSYQQQQVSYTQQQQQSSYGQQKQPSYAQKQQPSYAQQQQQPSYGQQKQQQPSYGQQKQPSYAQQQQQPSYGQPQQLSYAQKQQPSFAQQQQQPSYGQQKQPSYAQPQQPSYAQQQQQQQPSYGQPKPTYQQQPSQQQQQQPSYTQVQHQQRPGYQLLQQQLQEQERQQQQKQQASYQQQPSPQQPKQQAIYQQQPQQKQQASYQQQPQQKQQASYQQPPQQKQQTSYQQQQQVSYQQQQQQQNQQASYQQPPQQKQPASYQQQQQQQVSYQQQQKQQASYQQQPQQQKQQASYQQQQKQQISYQQQPQQPQQRYAHPQPQQQQYQQSVHTGVYRQGQPSVATITTITATSTTSTFAPPPTTTTTTTTTGEPFPWEDEPELGVYENEPEQRPDLVRESDRKWQAEELPSPGKARNLKQKFLMGDLEYRPEVRRRELTPPSMVGGGVFENEPAYNPDVVHAEEYQSESLPDRGTARYMADRFKQMGRTVYPSGPTPPKREITPDRTTRGEYVSEPRGFVETYEGRPESGVFESEPLYLPDVIKADEYEDDRLPERGLARNIAAHFRDVGRYRPPPTPSRPKEFTPPREEGTMLYGYGVYENMPQYDPTVVHAEDQAQDILPERGTARTIVTRFRKMSSGDSTPKSPRCKKEFTPPRDGGGVYENNPTQFIPEYNSRPESGVLENEPQVRYDVVRADEPPPYEVELPERGMARSMVTTWRHKESTSSRATPTGSGKPKEFTPPREEPRVLLQRASSVGYDGFGISEGSVHPSDLPGQYQPLAEASVFESQPVYLEDVYREADTDWMEGMPRQDVTRKMVAKFRHIQQQSSTDVPDYASPAARPPVPAGRQAQNIRY